MTKWTLTSISIFALLLSAGVIYSFDNPHNETESVACLSCHFPAGNPDEWWGETNTLCLSCHTGLTAIEEATHSSVMTSDRYGIWNRKCVDCHNPHSQRQWRAYSAPEVTVPEENYLYQGISSNVTGTTLTKTGAGWDPDQWKGNILLPDITYSNYQYRIFSNTSDTITLAAGNTIDTGKIKNNKTFVIIYGKLVKDKIETGVAAKVRFFRPEGDNSFADGIGTKEGICEVCHTKTIYHKKSGSVIAHNEGKNCTKECHKHIDGFKAVCDQCHGNPPGDRVVDIRPDLSTNSATSGVHDAHVKTHGIRCEACHFDSVGIGPTHKGETADKKITMGFNPFYDTYAGGKYDGQASPVSYDATTTDPVTNVTNDGTKQCSNIYCHGYTMISSGGTDTTPVWDNASTGACGTCHGATRADPPVLGSHSKHAGTSTLQASVACDVCHSEYTHVNTRIEWKFGTDERVTGAKYKGVSSGSEAMGSFPKNYDDGTCTQVYCHSNAEPAPNISPEDIKFDVKNEANSYKTVTWDSASMECDSCHRGKITDSNPMKSNGHYRLVGEGSNKRYECFICHDEVMDEAGNIKDPSKHVNNEKNVKMSAFSKIDGRPDPSYNPSTTSKICDNTYCHSDGTTDPETVRPFKWTDGKTRCSTCHGHQPGSCSNSGCHDGEWRDGQFWEVITKWDKTLGDEWKEAVPMFPNEGAGTPRANSHPRHMGKDISCNTCHSQTVTVDCKSCHKPQLAQAKDGEPYSNCPSSDADDNCTAALCHAAMEQTEHVDPVKHVDGYKSVVLQTGNFNAGTKSCSLTACHPQADPVWGGTSNIICMNCHQSNEPGGVDVDDFVQNNHVIGPPETGKSYLNLNEWNTTGHGRPTDDPGGGRPYGPYLSGNPAANFAGSNPCSYCHEPAVLHNDEDNPFRLRMLKEFSDRFDKECVYCHMTRNPNNSECIGCHVRTGELFESIAPETTNHGIMFRQKDGSWLEEFPMHVETSGCMDNVPNCHNDGTAQSDMNTFPSGAHRGHGEMDGTFTWTSEQLKDIKNQYRMMGVCLKCHEEDSHDECKQCHNSNEEKYTVGFDPDGSLGPMVRIKPSKAKATSVHFGHKHFEPAKIIQTKGGKFCWDCHDPHGDANLYMIQNKISSETDGTFGIPVTRKDVVFNDRSTGAGPGAYARRDYDNPAQYDGVCNVCHSAAKIRHYTSTSGNNHNYSRPCTECHEHRFTASHSSNQACNTCHGNKPVPSHTAFGLPRDCTKCHKGVIGMETNKRMNIMGQMNAKSHHVQGTTVTNKHCYACHWESTDSGMVDNDYHQGYNLKNHTSVPNAPSDLVVWGTSTTRPVTTVGHLVQFSATSIGTPTERANVAEVTKHCLGCHNTAQNNNTALFNDCKTPRQYAWDGSSVDERYSNKGVTTWGKYASTANAAKKNMTKAYSAHGNATANAGGFVAANGLDGDMSGVNTRAGSYNVECYDCHSSHGSAVSGITSSYVSFSGDKNGANLKETQSKVGGYLSVYYATSKPGGVNPFNPGAGQCFNCHETATAGGAPYRPWGYTSTYGATQPIMGYKDTLSFGPGSKGSKIRYPYFKEIVSTDNKMGGHLKRSTDPRPDMTSVPEGNINGLCSPCHDPHGVSSSLGGGMSYAVPLLKGTWMTSPYKEDVAQTDMGSPITYDSSPASGKDGYIYKNINPTPYVYTDQKTFGGGVCSGNANRVCLTDSDCTIGTSSAGYCMPTPRVNEDDTLFAGLCLSCHPKNALTNGTNNDGTWKSLDRVHETVKGWADNTQHSYTCSKCHQPHVSALPRLMTTDCLAYKHRGMVASGGKVAADRARYVFGPPHLDNSKPALYASGGFPVGYSGYTASMTGFYYEKNCHPTGTWPDNSWNSVTPW